MVEVLAICCFQTLRVGGSRYRDVLECQSDPQYIDSLLGNELTLMPPISNSSMSSMMLNFRDGLHVSAQS
jgi:hypothetical protein